ncbi:ATP-binding protein [Streptomyces sp. NPDC091279]|uniref:ATP-binding protein n=1 Tax=unclassified Streptomyces TaxID=2593676 RepID=UPI0038039FD6
MPETFASFKYPTAKRSVSRARTDCRTFLATCGATVTADLADELVLLVDELMSNAVTHGRVPGVTGRRVRLTLARTGEVLRVEVRDTQSDRLPHLHKAERDEERGRGLAIVDALSSAWGVTREVIGKTVWAEKTLTSPPFPQNP